MERPTLGCRRWNRLYKHKIQVTEDEEEGEEQ
jgi:hypothetical protein